MTSSARGIPLDFAALMSDNGAIDPIVHDLMSLVREAFLLDRSSPRGNTPDDPRWHRELDLRVPVLNPVTWSRPEVTDAVQGLLGWITDDDWSVQWGSGPPPPSLVGQSRFSLETNREVILFSGGLDAVAGAAHLLPKKPLEAVAIATNNRMQGYQALTVEALRRSGLGSLEWQPIRFAVSHGKRDAEPTRRTRGLVFLAVGAAMARRRGRSNMIMAENGIGALNLPLTGAQRGAMTSRSAHPKTLLLFERVMALVTDEPFSIDTPLLRLTKAEAIRQLPESAREACSVSESCDHAAAARGHLRSRCGYCSSCILRRMSLRAAGRADWDHKFYLSDVEAEDRDRNQEPEMLWQAARLDRALRTNDRSVLLREFPDLENVPRGSLDEASQHRLLQQYVEEWRRQPGERIRRFLPAASLAG